MSIPERSRAALRFLAEPGTQLFFSAPPIVIAGSPKVEFTCGTCDAVLILAQEGQVHGLVIRCTSCGGFNSTDW
jgi:predicted RNA-binding Zn-ribbon protein involved in translation (DUF1610 family)